MTQRAEDEFSRVDPKKWRKSGRVGGPMHVRTMALLLEEYWEKCYWCAFDRGDRTGLFPDILYTKPLIIYAKGKEGRTVARMSTDEWDEESRMPVEVEITPSKNPEQVRNNYVKDFAMCEWAMFVVVTRTQVTDIRNILLDKDRATFEVVYKDVGLPEDDLEKLIAQGDAPLPGAGEADGGKEAGAVEQGGVKLRPRTAQRHITLVSQNEILHRPQLMSPLYQTCCRAPTQSNLTNLPLNQRVPRIQREVSLQALFKALLGLVDFSNEATDGYNLY